MIEINDFFLQPFFSGSGVGVGSGSGSEGTTLINSNCLEIVVLSVLVSKKREGYRGVFYIWCV